METQTIERAHRIDYVAPAIASLTKKGFNVPLEVGGFLTAHELLMHIATIDDKEFEELRKTLNEMDRTFSSHVRKTNNKNTK